MMFPLLYFTWIGPQIPFLSMNPPSPLPASQTSRHLHPVNPPLSNRSALLLNDRFKSERKRKDVESSLLSDESSDCTLAFLHTCNRIRKGKEAMLPSLGLGSGGTLSRKQVFQSLVIETVAEHRLVDLSSKAGVAGPLLPPQAP